MTHYILQRIDSASYKKEFVKLLATLCIFYNSLCLAADTQSETSFEEESAIGTSNLFIAALGEYQHLNEQIYLGAIYLPLNVKEFEVSSGMSLIMHMAVAETSARRFTRMWMDAISLSASREQRQRLITQIQSFGEVYQQKLQRGDHITFEYLPNEQQTNFFHNEVMIDAIPGEEFFNLLLSVWIGDKSISSEFKEALESSVKKEISTSELDAFYVLDFDQERKSEIELLVNNEQKQNESRLVEENKLQEELRQQELLEQEEAREQEQLALAEQAREEKALEERRQAEEAERLRIAQLEEERIRQEQEALAKAKYEQEQKELRQAYTQELVNWIGHYVVYPETALRRGMQGRVEIEVSGDRNGNLIDREIIVSSGSQQLDRAAHNIVMSAEPLPSMPDDLEGESVSIVMPIAFILENN